MTNFTCKNFDALMVENIQLKSVIDAVRGVAAKSCGIAGWGTD